MHTHPDYAWYGKSDDDSLINLPRLRADLLSALTHARTCGRPRPYAYYGPMRWRLWAPKSYGGCGTQTEGGPPDEVPEELIKEAASCGGGPFPYGDGRSANALTLSLTLTLTLSLSLSLGAGLPGPRGCLLGAE